MSRTVLNIANQRFLWPVLHPHRPSPSTLLPSPIASPLRSRNPRISCARHASTAAALVEQTEDDDIPWEEVVETARRNEAKIATPNTSTSPLTKPRGDSDTSLFNSPDDAIPNPETKRTSKIKVDFTERPPRKTLDIGTPDWRIQKEALKYKFGDQKWNPRRKLSPDAQRGIRDLHAINPEFYTTPLLAEQFKVSPEAIRRILRSKWMDRLTEDKTHSHTQAATTSVLDDPDAQAGRGAMTQGEAKMSELRERWARRHDRIWDQRSELGLLPRRMRKRRAEGPGEGRARMEEELWRTEVLGNARREDGGGG